MAKFIRKCFREFALTAAAVLWAGCSDVDKDVKKVARETHKIEKTDEFTALETVKAEQVQNEKNDSILNDSVLAEISKNDSVSSGRMKKYKSDMLDGMGCYYGVVQNIDPNLFALNHTEKVQIKEIIIEKNSALKKDHVAKVVRNRVPGLRHVYYKYLKKDSVDVFEDKIFGGEIVLKLTIAADGSVKDVEKISSNTSKKLFEEEIIKLVGRWTFWRVKIGNTIATITLVFSKK